MFNSRRLSFKNLVLFGLAVSFCLLLNNLLLIDEAQSQVPLTNTQIIYPGSYKKQTEKEYLAKTLIDKAQTHNDLGQFRFSIPLLKQAIFIGQKSQNKEVTIVAQGVLGNSYILAGDYNGALEAYQNSLTLAQEIGNEKYITIALNGQVSIRLIRQKRYLTQTKEAQTEK